VSLNVSTPKQPVVCAGVLVADHLCTPIEHIPASGELVMADELVLNIGGCASNAAMVLAKLGVRASICGRVGNDVFGRFVADTLSKAGVDVTGLARDAKRATSQTLIVNVKGQDRRFIHSFGANAGLAAEDLDPLLANHPKVVYVGGFLILPGLDAHALAERFRAIRADGGITVLDVCTPGPADYLTDLRPVLAETDVFLPNTDEATLILGETDPVRQAEAFHAMGAGRVVITCGSQGSVVVSKGLKARVGTYPVTFVDGTGGGDAFDAGYIAGLLDGLDEIACLKLASVVGAGCVRAVGTTAGLFTRPEADDFIARHPLTIERLD
jgi:sugar/nucleoside kinase (ribokinase family)